MTLPDHRAPSSEEPAPREVGATTARRRSKAPLFLSIPVLFLATAAAYLAFRITGNPAPVARQAPGTAVVISTGDIYSTLRIAGTVVAERSAIIRAPRIMGSRADFNRGGGGAHDHGPGGHPDFILTLLRLAKPGTVVKAGDVVVQFDPENQVQRLDDYKDSVVQLRNSVRRMMANLAARKEEYAQQVRVAWADWQKAVLDQKTAEIRSEIDAEKLRLTTEEADLKYKQLLAQQALVEESQRASIRASELTLAESAVELGRVENNVKRMTMAAPIDGIVVMANLVINGELRQVREGDQVSPGQPVLYIVDASSMALNATVNQVDAERMRLGMRATISLDAYPGLSLNGVLTAVGAMAKTSSFRARYVGELLVRFRVQERDVRLLPDMTGSADVLVGAERNVLVAPRPSVIMENGRHFVQVKAEDGWMRREIVPGLRNATHVEVRSGLQAGDVVALQTAL
jgi:multidrug efflux pump subunit AcrA (membrane-fusion protein)